VISAVAALGAEISVRWRSRWRSHVYSVDVARVCYESILVNITLPSVLWHCSLGIRKSIWPVKNWVMRCWCGYLSVARCKRFAFGPADATISFLVSFTVNDVNCFVCFNIVYILLPCCNCSLPVINKLICYVTTTPSSLASLKSKLV